MAYITSPVWWLLRIPVTKWTFEGKIFLLSQETYWFKPSDASDEKPTMVPWQLELHFDLSSLAWKGQLGTQRPSNNISLQAIFHNQAKCVAPSICMGIIKVWRLFLFCLQFKIKKLIGFILKKYTGLNVLVFWNVWFQSVQSYQETKN